MFLTNLILIFFQHLRKNIILGEWNTATDPDCIDYPDGVRDCSDPIIVIAPEEIIPHPEFNVKNQMEHDIGLIRLRRDVVFTEFIKPICMPSAQLKSNAGDQLTVAGWGKTLENTRSAIKQKLVVNVNSHGECVNKFAYIFRTITENQMCAGGEYLEDSCAGDSGGPLMKLVNELQWYAEGLVSFGQTNCGSEGWPGIYTRVPAYVDWIRSNVKN